MLKLSIKLPNHRQLRLSLYGWGFHVTSSPPCWRTKTKDLSLAPFARPPEIVHCIIVIGVSSDWLQTMYTPYSKMAADLCGYKLARVAPSKINILLNFKLKNEASRANLNTNKRIFKWRPFWNKVY